jgi:tungstate transport system permease protein
MDFLVQGFLRAIELLVAADPETFSAVYATLAVSAYSLAVTLVVGLPLGFCLGYFDFRFKKQLRIVVDTLLSLPTVFIGLVVYAFFTNRGPLGEWGLLFTLPGIAVG